MPDIAYSVAPGAPWAWDARTSPTPPSRRYVREATDYAGGRRLDRGPRTDLASARPGAGLARAVAHADGS